MKKASGSLKVHVIRGIGLAVRDKWKRSSDPYVLLTLGVLVGKTRVIKNSLNPSWNEELTFWIPNNEPLLKLEVFDKDTFSSDDKMGDAEINLQPLIMAMRRLKERQRTSSDGEIAKVVADKYNWLVNDSHIRYASGNVVQDVHLRLRNVECGELKLQLKWVES